MALIQIVIVLAVVGLLLWSVLKYVPMAPPFPNLITVVVVICVILWLLQVFGLLSGIGAIHVGHNYGR